MKKNGKKDSKKYLSNSQSHLLRMKATIATLLLSTAATAVTLEADRKYELPAGWTTVGLSPRDTKIELAFAVKNQNVFKLTNILEQTSDPTSIKYGQHLTNKEVHDLVAPKREHIRAVHDHFATFGASSICMTSNCDW
jgi:subtilase family serine protease